MTEPADKPLETRVIVCFLEKIYPTVPQLQWSWWPPRYNIVRVKRHYPVLRVQADLDFGPIFTRDADLGPVEEGSQLLLYNGFPATVVNVVEYEAFRDVTVTAYVPDMNLDDECPESPYGKFLALMKFAGWVEEHGGVYFAH